MESHRRARRARALARWAPRVMAATLGLACLTGLARAEMSVGVRFGWSDVSDEFFEGSGELGGTNLVGAQLGLGLSPLVEFEVAGEYVREEFAFTEGLIGGIEAAGEGEWEDMALLATVRLVALSLPSLPVRIFVGGGLNVHWADLTLDAASLSPQDAPADEIQEAIEEVAGERSEVGWHAVGGLRLSPPASAICAFVEVRHQEGLDPDDLPKSNSIYGGLSIRL